MFDCVLNGAGTLCIEQIGQFLFRFRDLGIDSKSNRDKQLFLKRKSFNKRKENSISIFMKSSAFKKPFIFNMSNDKYTKTALREIRGVVFWVSTKLYC